MADNGSNGNARIARLGDVHGNAERIRGLQDLGTVRTQLDDVKNQLVHSENARTDLREILLQINRMVGGKSWTDPAEVKANVQRKLDNGSPARAAELEAQLAKQDDIEKQLRAATEHEKKRADQAVDTAKKFRQELATAKHELLQAETSLKNHQLELERMGNMKIVAEKAPAPTSDELSALMDLIQMERDDNAKLLRDILQAAADAAEQVRVGLLSEKNTARGIKAQNQGLLYGSAAVERAITRVIHNIKPKDIEQDNG